MINKNHSCFIFVISFLLGLLNGYILLFLNEDIRSLLTLFNSVDFQSYARLFRSGILSVEGGWGAIVEIPIEDDVLSASLNLEREFFVNAETTESALTKNSLSKSG